MGVALDFTPMDLNVFRCHRADFRGPVPIDQDRAGVTGQGRIAAANRLGIGASFARQTVRRGAG